MINPIRLIMVVMVGFISIPSFSWVGMPTPFLHVEGRNLKDPMGNTVVLRGGWMQPTESWFNGGGKYYSNPNDYTNPNNVAPMLNYLKEAATVMSDTSPKYGRTHGWYNTFVRMNTDAIGGWTQPDGLVNQAQFNGWIQNFIVPYAAHLRSRGLYFVVSATGPINTPNNGSRNAGVVEQARLRTFWTTFSNAPGVKNADNILFELMNEPVEIESVPGNGDWGMRQAKYYSAFRNWIQPVIDDVRKTGANNVVFVPTMEWQGSPQQHVQFPFTGTNCGVAVHLYPPYGNCNDNSLCHTNFWNSSYKPTAEKWPMIITENFWFPGNNGLVSGSTANYGNTLKKNIDATGNVSYMIGFLSDLLDLDKARPATAGLLYKEGAQAAFEWWYQYNSGKTPTQSPFKGIVHSIPGIIQAEEYDLGGNGVAYNDASPGNTGGATFRTDEDVDIEPCSDAGGGYNLGYATYGEWLEYTVNVGATGNYKLDLRVACNGNGRTLSLVMDGTSIANNIAIPNTAGWQTWMTTSVNNVPLTAGQHVLRLTIGAADFVNINYLTFSSVITGLEEDGVESMRLFPNPSHDGIFNLGRVIEWQVYNSMGEFIFHGTDKKIVLSEYPAGIYFMETKYGRQKLVRH